MSTSNRTRTPAETETIENRLRRAARCKGYLLVTAASSDTTAVAEPDSRAVDRTRGRVSTSWWEDGRAFIGGTASGVSLVSPG